MGVDDRRTTVDSDCRASPWWYLINGRCYQPGSGVPTAWAHPLSGHYLPLPQCFAAALYTPQPSSQGA